MSIYPRGFDLLKDVDVRLSVELGRAEMKLKDVLALGEESVVMLDRLTDELLDVLVNGKPIARGEIVAQNNRFGLRIVELAGSGEDSFAPQAQPESQPKHASGESGQQQGVA